MGNNLKCIFCERPEIRNRITIKTENAFAFPTNMPIVPGHMLICPNRCVAKISDMKQEEILGVLELTERLKPALRESLGATGFNIAWNEGEIAGQSVPHLHMHLLPRKQGDEGITEYEPRKFLYRPGSREPTPEAELLAVSQLVRKALEMSKGQNFKVWATK